MRTSELGAALSGAATLRATTTLLPALAASGWRHRAKLVGGEFAVAVFVECQERLWSLRNFVGGEFAIAIEVERFHQRPHRWVVSAAATAAWRTKIVSAAVLGSVTDGQCQNRSGREKVSRNLAHMGVTYELWRGR